jgi:hypothetical protein
MESVAMRERGVIARDELGKRFDSVRDQVAERVGEIDTKELRKQGESLREQGLDYASRFRRALLVRGFPVHMIPDPKPRRRRWPLAAVLAGVGVGAGVAIGAYLLYDRSRREKLRERLTQVQGVAQERYVQLGGVSGAVHQVRSRVQQQRGQSSNGSELSAKVGQAIAAGGDLPRGLDVEVEGRTVYLKGEVTDAAVADAAAERAHTVDGVVAVVNHTTSPAPPQG